MRKEVEKHLGDRGRRLQKPPRGPAPCDFNSLVDGFLVHVLDLDTEAYRRAFWREAYRNGHTIGHVPRTFTGFMRRNAHSPEAKLSLLLGVCALFGAYAGLQVIRNRLSHLVRRLRRPTYYERERARRRELAAERRKVRARHTLNPRPDYGAIRAALRAAHASPEGALRCGSLMMDLACFADASLRFDGNGRIAGRRGGVKRLLQREAPDLFGKYPTLMRHKATAQRFRQACGADDPVPADALLPAPGDAAARDKEGDTASPQRSGHRDITVRTEIGETSCAQREGRDITVRDGWATGPQRDIAREILGECEGTIISLEAALALRLDPDCIPLAGTEGGKGMRAGAGGGPVARKTCEGRWGRGRVLRRAVGWLWRRRVA